MGNRFIFEVRYYAKVAVSGRFAKAIAHLLIRIYRQTAFCVHCVNKRPMPFPEKMLFLQKCGIDPANPLPIVYIGVNAYNAL